MINLQDGEIVWTCAPTLDDLGGRLLRPRKVKLRLHKYGVLYGHRIIWPDEVSGLGLDDLDESNYSTMIATRHNCFVTEDEAWEFYKQDLVNWIEFLKQELDSVNELRKANENLSL